MKKLTKWISSKLNRKECISHYNGTTEILFDNIYKFELGFPRKM